MASLAPAQSPRRVACIGDSITYGDKIPDRDAQSYPAVLQRLSQGRFAVGNFGVNGATALKIPYRSWSDTAACAEAVAFAPDVAVVMLGINDLAFAGPAADYSAALRAVVVRFQNLPSRPRLYLCTLTPIAPEEQQAEANRAIRETMNPAIRAVAAETGAGLVDVAAAYPNRPELLPDGLHPSPEGAELIARTVLAALDAPAVPGIRPAPGPVDRSIRNEALAAKRRAEQWLGTRPAPADLPAPSPLRNGREIQDPGDVADLLPLLAGDEAAGGDDLYFSYATLAHALARIGHETVFLAADRPVAWRAALLHQLVQRQRIDAQGGGFWGDPASGGAVRATACALQAIAAALGE